MRGLSCYQGFSSIDMVFCGLIWVLPKVKRKGLWRSVY